MMFVDRLDERKRRKDFILERNLLHPSPFDDLSQEEKEFCRRYDVFMRFHSKDEHEELIKTVISEHRLLKRIRDLKVCFTSEKVHGPLLRLKSRLATESILVN